jgi:hypothetical protein
MRGSEKDPDTILTFVLVVDGEESLNVELVRQGCFAPQLEFVPLDRLQIPKADYLAFIKKLLPATQYAEQHKLGVFSDTRKSGD